MTDRDYVESTVAYLAEHVPWMWREWMDSVGVPKNATWRSVDPRHIVLVQYNQRASEGWSKCHCWKLVLESIMRCLNLKHHPLVSADWWDERDEPKLAELLRKQHADSILHDRGSTQVLHQDKEWTP